MGKGLELTIAEFTRELLELTNVHDIGELDIRNYLEAVTSDYQKEKVRMALKEMDMVFTMEYCEEVDTELFNKYQDEGWEIPVCSRYNPITKKETTVTDYAKMRLDNYPLRETLYRYAVRLLKEKIAERQHKHSETLLSFFGGNAALLNCFINSVIAIKNTGRTRITKPVAMHIKALQELCLVPDDIKGTIGYDTLYWEINKVVQIGDVKPRSNGKPKSTSFASAFDSNGLSDKQRMKEKQEMENIKKLYGKFKATQ